jgi:hypothetical protein
MEEHFTRLRAPYFNRDGFRFHIYHARLRDKVGERLGIHDIHTGNAAFDDAFVVKSNKPEQIKRLLADECVRTHLLKLPEVDLCVHDHEGDLGPAFPPGVDDLQFKVPGVVDDVEKLREAFALFADVLRALTTLGSATDKTPGIQL